MVRGKPELTFEEVKEEGFLMSVSLYNITLGEFHVSRQRKCAIAFFPSLAKKKQKRKSGVIDIKRIKYKRRSLLNNEASVIDLIIFLVFNLTADK